MADRDDKVWLIKSTQRILGPFSQTEIFSKLKTSEFGLNDDTCSPGRRWQNIQVHPEFREMVAEIRRTQVSDETEVSWSPTKTQTLTDFSDDSDLTEDLGDKLSQLTKTAEIVVHDLPEEKRGAGRGAGAARFQTAALGQNPALLKRADRTARWLWLITGLALVCALAFLLQKRMANHDNRPTSIDSLRVQVPMIIQAGDYQQALTDLKSFFHDPMKSGDMGIYFGPLLIQVDGQTELGRRVLEQMLSNNQGDAKMELTALAVADLIESQTSAAKEDLSKALSFDANYVPALINMAVVQFLMGNYEDARRTALSAIRANPGEGEAQLLLAENAVYLNRTTKSVEAVDEALNELAHYRAHQMDYEVEASFYTIYLNWLRQNHKLDLDKINAWLELDPQLTEDHRHDIFVFKGQTGWTVLGPFCDQIAEQMAEDPHGTVLHAVCAVKAGRKADARNWIDKAVQQSPIDPIVQAWYSYILNDNGKGDQASVALGRAGEMNRKGDHELPILMQARFSQQEGDFDTARKNWQKIYQKNERSISALGGLAISSAALKSNGEAAGYIDHGLKVSPDYIPLLKLRMKGEKEGWYGR